jgi:hypothetical protein
MNGLEPHRLFGLTEQLLPEEKKALEEYKIAASGLAYQMNAFLRGHQDAAPPNPVRYRQLDSAIHKSRTLASVILFRATFAEDFDCFVRNGIFHDPAYASTSLSESNLGGHFVNGISKRPIKLVISCPHGANAFYLEFTNDNGETESECLLPRCGRYRVDTELPPVTETRAIAKEMGQNNWYHAKDFNDLRIIKLSLLV